MNTRDRAGGGVLVKNRKVRNTKKVSRRWERPLLFSKRKEEGGGKSQLKPKIGGVPVQGWGRRKGDERKRNFQRLSFKQDEERGVKKQRWYHAKFMPVGGMTFGR